MAEQMQIVEVEVLKEELAKVQKKLSETEHLRKYLSTENTNLNSEIERVHQILDNLARPAPRSEPKTDDNQWPAKYLLSTRLAIWLGTRII